MGKKIFCFVLFLFFGVCSVLNAETANLDTTYEMLEQLNIEQTMEVTQMLSGWMSFKDELKITDAQAKQLSQLQIEFQRKMLSAQQASIDMQQKMLDQNYTFGEGNLDKILDSSLEEIKKINKDIEGINQKLKRILTKEQYNKLKSIDSNAVFEKELENSKEELEQLEKELENSKKELKELEMKDIK